MLYRLITQPGRSPNKKAPIAHLLCRFGARLAPTDVITDEQKQKNGSWSSELEICVRLWTSQYDNGQQLTLIPGHWQRNHCDSMVERRLVPLSVYRQSPRTRRSTHAPAAPARRLQLRIAHGSTRPGRRRPSALQGSTARAQALPSPATRWGYSRRRHRDRLGRPSPRALPLPSTRVAHQRPTLAVMAISPILRCGSTQLSGRAATTQRSHRAPAPATNSLVLVRPSRSGHY